MSSLKPIVTDTYDFPTLIRDGNVYVDKTALLHRLISRVDGSFFFMSRPRRFGKSLMLSTLEQIGAKGYEKPYAADKRRVMAIGVNHNPRKAGIKAVSEVVNPSDEVVNPVDEVVNEVVIASGSAQAGTCAIGRQEPCDGRARTGLLDLVRPDRIPRRPEERRVLRHLRRK